MEDYFQIILYVIIAIIILVVNVLGKKKQEELKKNYHDLTTEDEDISKDISDSILLRQEKVIKEKIPQSVPVVEVNELNKTKARYFLSEESSEKEEVLTNTDNPEFSLSEENIKEAIIYSELLNRRTY